MKKLPLLLSLLVIVSAFPAAAQMANDPAAQARMDRIEHDMMLLQRQVARAPVSSAPISEGDVAASGGPAQLEVRLSTIEEEIRALRGKVEENEFQVRKLSEALDKFKTDTEFRFNEAASKPAAAAAETPAAEAKPKKVELIKEKKLDSENAKLSVTPPEKTPAVTTAGDGVLRAPEKTDSAATDTGAEENFATPRDHYNYGFRLLNQTKYEEAARAFDSFTKKYPKDPLVGNAYYWQGETYYIRRDYVNAADSFRQGFEAMPTGPKAPDNLLKLAMSLDALDRDKEACVVLGQVTTKYKKSSASVAEKAEAEQKRIGCH